MQLRARDMIADAGQTWIGGITTETGAVVANEAEVGVAHRHADTAPG